MAGATRLALLPNPSHEKPLLISLLAAAAISSATAQSGTPPQWPELEEVIITWKCHLDIGYTHPVPEVIEKYRTRDMDQTSFDVRENPGRAGGGAVPLDASGVGCGHRA
jgi:hypothetical protein